MKFSFESLFSSISQSFSLRKTLFTFLHLLSGFLILGSFIYIGSKTGMLGSIGLGLIGFVSFYYILVRAYYLSTFFALHEIENNEKPNYFSAKCSFKILKWPALFTPIVFILFLFTIIIIELLLMGLISHIPVIGTVIQTFLILPFFIFNFFLLAGVFTGFNLCFSAIIKEKKTIAQTFRIVLLLLKKRFHILLFYKIVSGFILLIVSAVILFIASLALLTAAAPMTQNILNFISLKSILHLFSQSNSILFAFLCISGTAIIAFFLAYLFNISARINAFLYLSSKEAIDMNKKGFFRFWKRKG